MTTQPPIPPQHDKIQTLIRLLRELAKAFGVDDAIKLVVFGGWTIATVLHGGGLVGQRIFGEIALFVSFVSLGAFYFAARLFNRKMRRGEREKIATPGASARLSPPSASKESSCESIVVNQGSHK